MVAAFVVVVVGRGPSAHGCHGIASSLLLFLIVYMLSLTDFEIETNILTANLGIWLKCRELKKEKSPLLIGLM